MTTELKVDNIANADIDHSEEALVAFLELSLVKDLYCNHGRVLDGAVERKR